MKLTKKNVETLTLPVLDKPYYKIFRDDQVKGFALRVTSDGSTTATATLGAAVASGATYEDNLAGTVSTNCRCTAATCEVVIVECP